MSLFCLWGTIKWEQAVNVLLDKFMEQYFLCAFNIDLWEKQNYGLLPFYTKQGLKETWYISYNFIECIKCKKFLCFSLFMTISYLYMYSHTHIYNLIKYISIFKIRIKKNINDIYIHIYIYTHTLTGLFLRYTLLVPGWTPFCLQNCLNSSWHRFNKVLETFLRDFGPYWHDSITQLRQNRWDKAG